MAKVDLKSAFRMVPIQASEWSSEWLQSRPLNGVPMHSEAWIGTILNADFDEAPPPYHLNSEARADIRWWNSFLPSWNGISILISPDWNYAESNPVVHGCLWHLWLWGLVQRNCHTSASRAGRALEGRLRHLLHRAVAPSTSIPYTGQGPGSTTPSVTNLT